jgi:hypothetical protein
MEKIMVEISRYFALISHFGSCNYILYNILARQMTIVIFADIWKSIKIITIRREDLVKFFWVKQRKYCSKTGI